MPNYLKPNRMHLVVTDQVPVKVKAQKHSQHVMVVKMYMKNKCEAVVCLSAECVYLW